MPQSLAQIYVHLIFSTKDRRPLIDDAQVESLRAYLAGVCNNIECPLLAAGIVSDHVHLLYVNAKTVSVADAVEKIKSNSSRWMNENAAGQGRFQWQRGYAAFSVSATRIPPLEQYLASQREHHMTVTFQDELREFFSQYRVDFDEKYVWD